MGDNKEKLISSDFSKIQGDETTSPSQLNEVSTCPDFTFSNSLRSPEGPMRGRSVKDFEEQLGSLKKENFNLKVRIYFLEERMGANFNLDKENIVKNNVELMVEIESLKKELQEKHELLCQAVKAMDLEEDEFKKTAKAKNDEIAALKQEIEELKLQIQDGKYENDNESSHKSYHSEPIFFSSQLAGLPECSSRIRIFQERISSLENELSHEKQNSASLQMILDQADMINAKYELLESESEKKDAIIKNLNKELEATKDQINKLLSHIKELESCKEHAKAESQRLSKLLTEKTKITEDMEEHLSEVKRKYGSVKMDLDKERQKLERNKFLNEMKITEMEEEIEKHKTRIQELQKKLSAANQELKENQNLLVPKSPKSRSIATNTDSGNVSVPNATTSVGVPKEDALRNALTQKSPSKSPVAQTTFDFTTIYKIINTVMFSNKPQLIKQLDLLKDTLSTSEQKIVHLKAQELKACAIIKNLMQHRKNSDEQSEMLRRRISMLEKELEGVVSKPEVKEISSKDHEVSEDYMNEAECRALIIELENKIKVLELTLKEKKIHIQYIEAQNLELLNNLQNKEKHMINLERTMSNKEEQTENSKEASNNMYSKLFDEKNREIEKLNEELRKRTYDLQAVVNNELWQKNREIEKLQIKYSQLLEKKEKEMAEIRNDFSSLSANLKELKAENEEKDAENSILKIDISDLKLQLQLLRDKIGEIGLVPDDKLEVEIIISSLDEVKNIQKQLEEVKYEKELLTQKIAELEGSVEKEKECEVISPCEIELQTLKGHLEMSEALRSQSNEACHILRAQLEELAVFLDSLMKQKSVLGFLGTTQNKRLKEVIEHSLDLSKSINMSISMNPEQSLMQLSNITALLNGSDMSNVTTNEDSNRYSFSIMPDQATLTYQSHIFKIGDEKLEQNQSFILKSLQDQIEMLQRELKIKSGELNRLKRESKNGKDLKLSHSKPRISPTKLKNVLTVRSDKADSESETWSEPDVNVSKARIGLFQDENLVGVEEIHSSDSTDESLTQLNRRRSDILNDCQSTITKLNKQVQDLQQRVQELQQKVQEKEGYWRELQEAKENNISLNKENDQMRVHLQQLEIELEEAKNEVIKIENEKKEMENQKSEIENEVNLLKNKINELEKSKQEMMRNFDSKDKEMCDKINQMKFERDQLVNMAKEYANMTENSRQEIVEFEKKITQLTIEKENMEKVLRKEYECRITEKLKDAKQDFANRINEIQLEACKEVNQLNEQLSELVKNYSENYVKNSEVEAKGKEIDALKVELENVTTVLSNCRKTAELNGNDGKRMKEEINNLHAKVNQITFQYTEAVMEKTRLEQDLNEVSNKKSELQAKLNDVQQELSLVKEHFQKEIHRLQSCKSKLELKVSELEFGNADLHNRLAKLQCESNDHLFSSSLPIHLSQTVDNNSRSIPIQQISPFSRQISNSSQSYVSEDEVRTRGIFSIVVPQKSVDSERIEANSSPDLGIESDQGRFSSLEVQTQVPRPLLQTIEIAESMNNLLDGDSVEGSLCGNKTCYQKSVELIQENNSLKRKLMKTRKALEDTVTQLTLANQRKKQVEKNICRQIHKTSQVLREAKANLDSGSETDFHKK